MRTTGKLAIVAAVVAGAAVPMTAPASAQASAAGGWEAYHGLTTKQSVERATRLMKQGYRPITVNVSDGERYAAVWEKGGSPDQYGIWQGMSASGYQKRFDAAMKQGGQPVSVSATGPAGSAVFAAVFEKKRGAFLAKSNLKGSVFAAYNKHAEANGLALTSVDAYGTPGDVRYAAVWSANTGGEWYYSYGKNKQQHAAEFKARKAKGFRPVRVAVAPDGTYTAVWRKDGVKSWAHYVDMTAADYQARTTALKAKGLHPVQVNAENGVYAAIWQ
ncbi:hypothetical protein ACFFR3_04450 [Nonomuraea salmonea]|uniref:Beta-lactamase n=1 Tax=Nonomuraea salmonea TaxID=46181 RepID=A0ABV5NEQ6_9ACTN